MSRSFRRRQLTLLLLAAPAATLLPSESVQAFGEEGAFHPRLLVLDGDPAAPTKLELEEAKRAASRWAWEVVRRTSAPGRMAVDTVTPARLLEEPFVIWSGARAPKALSQRDVRHLRRYLKLGGTLVVDDRSPVSGAFSRGVRKQLARVLPEGAPSVLPAEHVLYKTFYLVDAPMGRTDGPRTLSGISTGSKLQVLFLQHDLLGALARTKDGRSWEHPVQPGGAAQRERALRFAVNIALYVLCSDYKDDQVHAPFLMRRRRGRQ